jgi:hypothetical protein
MTASEAAVAAVVLMKSRRVGDIVSAMARRPPS